MKEILLYEADDGTVFSTAEEAKKRDKRHKAGKEKSLLASGVVLAEALYCEFAAGVHTRHQCECKERWCRGLKCFMCLIEEFIDESY